MFMVGSFAGGLSEGLESGWKLGKDIRGYQERSDAISKAEKEKNAKAGAGGLPPLIDVGAKAPSPLEADPAGTGTSGGAEYHPDHELGNKPYKPPVATAAIPPPGDPNAEFQYGGATPAAKPAAAVPPATGPVVAEAPIPPPTPAAVPPTALGGGAMAAGSPLNRWLGNTAAGIGNAISGAVGFDPTTGLYPQGSPTYDPNYAPEQPTPSPLPSSRGIGTVLPSRSALPAPLPRQLNRSPARPGAYLTPGSGFVGGQVPPASPTSPVFTAPIPPPIDPNTGLPYQQALY